MISSSNTRVLECNVNRFLQYFCRNGKLALLRPLAYRKPSLGAFFISGFAYRDTHWHFDCSPLCFTLFAISSRTLSKATGLLHLHASLSKASTGGFLHLLQVQHSTEKGAPQIIDNEINMPFFRYVRTS